MGHQLSDNMPMTNNNIRTPNEPSSAMSAPRTSTLSYSAVAMKKNPPPMNNNNRVQCGPKPGMPVVPDLIQPAQQIEATAGNMNAAQPPVAMPAQGVPPQLVANGHVNMPPKVSPQPAPPRTPEALAAAKQQVIQEAKKKASMGHAGANLAQTTPSLIPAATTTSLVSSQVTTSITSTSPVTSTMHQQPQSQLSSQIAQQQQQQQQQRQSPIFTNTGPPSRPQNLVNDATEKSVRQLSGLSIDASDKNINSDTKSTDPALVASVSPKDRSRGEDGKQFLMKYGRKIQTTTEGNFLNSESIVILWYICCTS